MAPITTTTSAFTAAADAAAFDISSGNNTTAATANSKHASTASAAFTTSNSLIHNHPHNYHNLPPSSPSTAPSSPPSETSLSSIATTFASSDSAVAAAATTTLTSPIALFAASHSSSSSSIIADPSASSLSAVATAHVQCQVRTRIPSEWGGEHHVLLYTNDQDSMEHLALVWGYGRAVGTDGARLVSRSLEAAHHPAETTTDRAIRGCSIPDAASAPTTATTTAAPLLDVPVLARIHSCCFTGETLGSLRCDCKEQLQVAMQRIAETGVGIVVYLQQEGRGIGLREKLKAYNLIDRGYDTLEANVALGHPADGRTYQVASAILRDLGVAAVRLLTNNPHKMEAMERDGVVVDERVPMVPESWSRARGADAVDDRDGYLITKARRMGHMIEIPSGVAKAVAENGSGLSTVSSNGSPCPSF
ncbi:GTP cyclohydrolase II-domain-containing protein [Zopfochytrium polystomum]|nr:GTP cyclohydrolase II-domain-containing protein [Zopfochytrium polystomum]